MPESQHPEHQEAINAKRIAQIFETVAMQSESIRNLIRTCESQLRSIERLDRRIKALEGKAERE